jgi:hypothetical protein
MSNTEYSQSYEKSLKTPSKKAKKKAKEVPSFFEKVGKALKKK